MQVLDAVRLEQAVGVARVGVVRRRRLLRRRAPVTAARRNGYATSRCLCTGPEAAIALSSFQLEAARA